MQAEVAAKVGAVGKRLVAGPTDVVAGYGVDIAVLQPVVVGAKRLAAKVAGEGSLICVDQHVPLQLHRL